MTAPVLPPLTIAVPKTERPAANEADSGFDRVLQRQVETRAERDGAATRRRGDRQPRSVDRRDDEPDTDGVGAREVDRDVDRVDRRESDRGPDRVEAREPDRDVAGTDRRENDGGADAEDRPSQDRPGDSVEPRRRTEQARHDEHGVTGAGALGAVAAQDPVPDPAVAPDHVSTGSVSAAEDATRTTPTDPAVPVTTGPDAAAPATEVVPIATAAESAGPSSESTGSAHASSAPLADRAGIDAAVAAETEPPATADPEIEPTASTESATATPTPPGNEDAGRLDGRGESHTDAGDRGRPGHAEDGNDPRTHTRARPDGVPLPVATPARVPGGPSSGRLGGPGSSPGGATTPGPTPVGATTAGPAVAVPGASSAPTASGPASPAGDTAAPAPTTNVTGAGAATTASATTGATAEAATRPTGPTPAAVRIAELAEQLQDRPPPRALTIELAELDGARVRVALQAGGVKVTVLDGDMDAGARAALDRELGNALGAKGFDLAGSDGGRGRARQQGRNGDDDTTWSPPWTRPPAPPARTGPVEEGVRL